MRKIAYLGLLLGGGYVCYKVYRRYTAIPLYNKLEPVPVQVEEVEQRFLSRKETFSGSLQADKSVTITAEVPGRVKKLNLVEGQFVEEGAVLVEIENEQQLANLNLYQVQYDRALQNLERAKRLAAQGDIPKLALKDKEAEFAAAKAKRDEAESMVKRMTITAPFDGVVGLRKISIGAYVQPNTEIAKFNKLDPLRVMFSVPVDRRPYVVLDNTVQVTVGDDPLPVFAKIIAKESNLQAHNHLLDVVALLDNGDHTYLPGQHAQVNMTTSQETEVLAVPESALLYGDNDRVYVFIAKDGMAEERTVELGLRKSGGYIEVTEGLEEGDKVVIEVGDTRGSRLIDGSTVVVKGDNE